MKIEMSPSVYLALCALVKDAMEVDSDATPVLQQAARELSAVLATLDLPGEVNVRKDAIADMMDGVPTKTSASSAA